MQPSSLNAPAPHLKRWVPPWAMGRRGLILAAAIPATGAVALGWPWLVAVGAAPLLLSAAPCLAMCALGLCMKGMNGKSCPSASRASSQSPQIPKDTTNA